MGVLLLFRWKKKKNATSTTFLETNHRWLVVINSNLKLTLRLLFAPTIIISNNLLLKIYCKNVVNISFLKKELKNVKF